MYNIIIANGANLTNNSTLNVYGNFGQDGTLTSSSSSNVILVGSGILSGSTTFRNLEITGTYTVGSVITDKTSVTGVLKKTSGTLTTSNKLTLVSTATGSALIQELGGTLIGKAYIQHYTNGIIGYHQFGCPVNDATVSTWSSSFPITGANNAQAWIPSKYGTLQIYNEVANTTSSLDTGYYNYTSLSGLLTPGKGFSAYLVGATTLSTFGTPNNGVLTIPVTRTAGTNDPRGWNLVSNPYPSPISWTALKANNPNMFADASCYIWKTTGFKNGVWAEFNGTVGTNSSGNVDIINSSQGFFIYVNKTGTLSFNNTLRNYTNLTPSIFGTGTVANQINVSVNDLSSGESDEAIAYTGFEENQSRKMEQPLEAMNPTISFDVNGTKASINIIKDINTETVLPLNVSTPVTGSYSLKFEIKNTQLPVYLKDALNGTLTDVKSVGEVFITTTAVETVNRFSIVFKAPKVLVQDGYIVYAESNNIVVTNPVRTGATIVVYNTLGQLVAKTVMNGNSITLPMSTTSSHYVVKILESSGGNVVKQVIIK